ncbi:MAG: 1-deoxy-D-xylulose-5-phosphate synthase, partial [Eubacterium sp.]|nr:1-deoxy-D-xylulose-5-phosphate synthase [Eubacterium sp.]
IAEEHAVTFAAGLALEGKKPFVCIYSSFFQRAYDQILQDVCLQDLPVRLLFDRAGLVGQDGETHQGIFDIAYLSSMPNMTILAPNSDQELMDAIDYAKDFARPIAIRYSRGAAYHTDFKEEFEYGKSVVVHEGEDVCVIAVGNIYEEASKARLKFKEEGKRITLVNARFIKPLDTEMIKDMASKHKAIIVVEEGIKRGGYGEAVEIFINENKLDVEVETIAIEDKFIEHGNVDQLRSQIGISSEDIVDKVKKYL